MILTCNSCHHVFDSDELVRHCPSCGTATIMIRVRTGEVDKTVPVPAIRLADKNEVEAFQYALKEAEIENLLDQQSLEARKRLRAALGIIDSVDGSGHAGLTDSEYNMLLMLSCFYAIATNPKSWLEPVLGLKRFRPYGRGRAADPSLDTQRLYETVKSIFKSEVQRSVIPKKQKTDPADPFPAFSAPVSYLDTRAWIVTQLFGRFRINDEDRPDNRKRTPGAIVQAVDIGELCENPGDTYLATVAKLVESAVDRGDGRQDL